MFTLAVFIGIYSYLIFFLGIFSLLTKENIWIVSLLWFLVLLFVEKKSLLFLFFRLKNIRFSLSFKYWEILPLILLISVNLIGALGPELAFDALWYHLTLPKLYLLQHAIYHIPGGLLYYSDMPKLGEMLYTGALSFGNEIFAKFVHYLFGIFISISLYKFSRKFFNQTVALLIVVIFYSNLVVDWESITAYIDLIRSFFELLSLWSLINWFESEKSTWLVVSGIMMGLAITTKLLAIGSFLILLGLIVFIIIKRKNLFKELLSKSLLFTFCTLLIPLPWFIFSYLHTGNPVFPFFTKTYEVAASNPNLISVFKDLWDLFIHSADPISPVYLVFLPLLFVLFGKLKTEIKIIVWYAGLSLLLWYFTPRTGGGRFILPYLASFSVVCGAIYSEILKKKETEWKFISKILMSVIVFVAVISIGYRGVANIKYVTVIIGNESKQTFLSNNLNFSYGDFYDTDGYFANHIKTTDTVLLLGFHNLYYVNFPYVDSSWVKRGDQFNYIATQNVKIPMKYSNWQLIYSNDKTMVQLFRPPKGICMEKCDY